MPVDPHISEVHDRDLVQLEARGWILANILPFRFHYWRGDLARSHYRRETSLYRSGDFWTSELTVEQVLATLYAILVWAEIEIKLVLSAVTGGDTVAEALVKYRRITKVNYAWCFVGILRSIGAHLRDLYLKGIAMDAEGEFLKEYLGKITSAEVAVTHRLEDCLTAASSRLLEEKGAPSWSLLRQPEFGWWNQFVRETRNSFGGR